MAYPRQLSVEKILDVAIQMLLRNPETGLRPLAKEMGVKAPSLYRYFDSKETLEKAMAIEGYRRLALALQASAGKSQAFAALAKAYRKFALAHPRLYHLMHRPGHEPAYSGAAADMVSETLAGALNMDPSSARFVNFFRCLRAYVHGFVSLELNGQFTAPGSVEKAFDQGLALIGRGLESG